MGARRPISTIGVMVAALLGCGPSGPELGRVTGRVMMEGQPVTAGSVSFWPGDGRPARGSIAEDGTYELTTFKRNDGALVGEHRVTIKATRLSEPVPELDSTAAEIAHFSRKGAKRIRAAHVTWVVPEEYSEVDTSPLVATVVSGQNELDFSIEKE